MSQASVAMSALPALFSTPFSGTEGDAVCKEINKLMATSGNFMLNQLPHSQTVPTASPVPAPDLSGIVSTYQNKKTKTAVDDKRMKRIMANRRSARESRERRKVLQVKLEASVSKLSSDHAKLLRENEELHRRIKDMIQAKKDEENSESLPKPTYPQGWLAQPNPAVNDGVSSSASVSPVESSTDHANAIRPSTQLLFPGLQPNRGVDLSSLLLSGAIQRTLMASAAPQQQLQPNMHQIPPNNKHEILAALAAARLPSLDTPTSATSPHFSHLAFRR
uniref:BZIP domain-containing protein n=1 Tax=Trieres chinensis TaxID=1514140 RepID=A0A7S2AB51_TRICV|eukprot:CAMPEP_0183302892 /NCGR_PEP_ID=MMETSP0160_2-20130417/8520_1 /TAXON_ID=2839 ORGANISM="Odontella Sinensis, Strain Grunow 1884" /NCGR_SAMPLE_ID=MMETSP0160_2 /ASSEMBLY_ACC=CAM_ASM_000250 /LENGTH=276 /DNA_ID=CAMNT_0025465717 /DNA_START=104 /DNA_END=934 /DNA_ORIENTATION=-